MACNFLKENRELMKKSAQCVTGSVTEADQKKINDHCAGCTECFDFLHEAIRDAHPHC